MSRTDSLNTDSPTNGRGVLSNLQGKQVCPFCGSINMQPDQKCTRCAMQNTQASQNATRARIGPWYVLQTRNPSAPGMNFATLMSLVKKGQVTARSIVRGPTTDQLWRFAAHVKGLSRKFGLCFHCGQEIDPSANLCPHCNRMQEPPINPDVLLETRETTASKLPVRREVPPPAETSDIVLPAFGDPSPLKNRQAQASGPEVQLPMLPSPNLPERLTNRERSMNDRPTPDRFDLSVPHTPSPSQSEDGILSAKELATAFRLNFRPGTKPPRSGRKIKTAMLVLFVFIVAGSAMLYLNLEARQGVIDWAQQTYASVRSKASGDALPKEGLRPKIPSPPISDPLSASGREDMPKIDMPREDLPDVEVMNLPPPSEAAAPDIEIRARIEQENIQKDISGLDKIEIETMPVVKEPESPAPPPEPELSPVEMRDLSRKLRISAMDAAARGDFTEAVRLFEQIKHLPPAYWPGDLELRLEAAKRQVK